MTRTSASFHRLLAALTLTSSGAALGIGGCADLAADCREGNCLGAGGGGLASSTSSSAPGHGGAGGHGGAATSGEGGAGGSAPTSCDPKLANDAVANSCGVFVSTTKGSNSADAEGTKEKPFASLDKAIAHAASTGAKALYVCGEKFTESAQLPSGIDVYGGLDCAKNWRPKAGLKSALHGVTDQIALRVVGAGQSRLRDVAIVAANATNPGGSSIALLVSEATLDLEDVDLTAGDAAAGATGASEPMAAKSGTKGSQGKTGCISNASVQPDVAPKTACDDLSLSIAGNGGVGNEFDGAAGTSGNSQPLVAYSNGGAGQTAAGIACKDGTAGLPGVPGMPGDGAVGLGTLDVTKGFVGVVGGAGKSNGTPGQGGGGGGGGSGKKSCTDTMFAAPSGGSGGSGGCGGKSASGGDSGGSSIALVSLNAKITFKSGSLTAKSGGAGGQGGAGQEGGAGFGGGGGGIGNSSDACKGGQGGAGGRGGAGGGGRGGHSIGLAYLGTKPDTDEAAVPIKAGAAGKGGPGGNGGEMNIGGAGAPGVSAAMQSFDMP
ncbi:MAG: hypothetical protein FJ095_05650 [Deltaproteobacteria bacterium]|nr:hypothetical protein [Deltaproteobacteria bacterium]